VFGVASCKKDKEDQNVFKTTTLADVGIYECLEPGLYLLNEQAVKSEKAVIQTTTFNDGSSWTGTKADIYHITISNAGKNYSSFCGAYISNGFGTSYDYQSAALNPVKKAQIISALNYIYDTYGSLNGWVECEPKGFITPANATYVVGQCVIWMILDYIDADGELVQPQNGIVSVYPQYAEPGKEYRKYVELGIGWGLPYEGASFETAINNAYAAATTGYTGSNTVTDIAYLAGPNYPNDIASWQPQIIPLGGTPPPVLGPSVGTVTATNAGNIPAILAGLNPKNGNAVWNGVGKAGNTPFVVPGSNHFVFAKATRTELEAGINLEFLVGNNYQIVGTGFAKLENDSITVTINKYAKGDFGVIAFNQLPVVKNGNIHSAKISEVSPFGALYAFSHDKKLTVKCPAGNDIWLYFHAGAMNFYL
jgi:hypothetical protein